MHQYIWLCYNRHLAAPVLYRISGASAVARRRASRVIAGPRDARNRRREGSMPYNALDELPPAVRKLPRHGREIFRAAFNSAWHSQAGRTASEREETAFRVAWAAVNKRYRKIGEDWVEK